MYLHVNCQMVPFALSFRNPLTVKGAGWRYHRFMYNFEPTAW